MSNTEEAIEALCAACHTTGSQKAWTLANGFHPSFIGRVLKGKQEPSERLLKALGCEWVVRKKS